MPTERYLELVMMELCLDLRSLGLGETAENHPSLFGEYVRTTREEADAARQALYSDPTLG